MLQQLKEFWFTKVWVGQIVTPKAKLEDENKSFAEKYRAEIAMAIPAIFVWVCYIIVMFFGEELLKSQNGDLGVWVEKFCPAEHDHRDVGEHDGSNVTEVTVTGDNSVTTTFSPTPANISDTTTYYIGCPDNGIPRWFMALVMVLGALVAGATSEGAGAIAFPVMTLVLKLTPVVARDFSLMSQSVGMPAAMFTIFYMRVQLVQLHVIITASLAGILGLAIGMVYVAPLLTPPYIKMWFAVIWASFAMALYSLNKNESRTVYDKIPAWSDSKWIEIKVWNAEKTLVINWKTLVIIAAGLVGGIFTALAGNGMDICCFSVLTLLFRVNEKTATPTSVVLMAMVWWVVINFLF